MVGAAGPVWLFELRTLVPGLLLVLALFQFREHAFSLPSVALRIVR